MKLRSIALCVSLLVFAAVFSSAERTRADLVPEDTLLIELMTGKVVGQDAVRQVVVEMYPDSAPKHVARIRELARCRRPGKQAQPGSGRTRREGRGRTSLHDWLLQKPLAGAQTGSSSG